MRKIQSKKKIDKILDLLNNDGVIIYPTDTVYGIGCSITSRTAIDKIARIKGINPGKERFSLIFDSLSQVSEYAKNIYTPVFKVMKKAFPGPYTFILNSSSKLPKLLNSPKNQLVYECLDKDDKRLKNLLRRSDLMLQTDTSSYYLLDD